MKTYFVFRNRFNLKVKQNLIKQACTENVTSLFIGQGSDVSQSKSSIDNPKQSKRCSHIWFFPQVNIKELRALTSISNVLSYTVMRLLQSVSSYTTFTWAQRHILHRLACQAFRPRTCSTLHNSEEDTVVILHAEVNLASESLRIHGELIYLSIWLVENRFFFLINLDESGV